MNNPEFSNFDLSPFGNSDIEAFEEFVKKRGRKLTQSDIADIDVRADDLRRELEVERVKELLAKNLGLKVLNSALSQFLNQAYNKAFFRHEEWDPIPEDDRTIIKDYEDHILNILFNRSRKC